jgi:NAD(P)-dependent dehydrogenase (short-subunit alcohol dehydrogenase family)
MRYAPVPGGPGGAAGGFGVHDERWTVAGKTCLVTGATSGHGRAVAEALLARGANVVLHGRDPERCRAAREALAARRGRRPEILLCDLASRAAIDRAADEWLAAGRPLHVLVSNAGLVSRDRKETRDGVELTFAVNHLAAFQLILRLLPALRAAAPSRIVIVGSDAHFVADPALPDPQSRRRYGFMRAYAISKLALGYFAQELARRLDGTGVTVNVVDPGPVASGIADREPGLLAALARPLIRHLFPSPERAARTAVHLAASPDLAGATGRYWRFMAPKAHRRPPDRAVIDRLWAESARLSGADLPDE